MSGRISMLGTLCLALSLEQRGSAQSQASGATLTAPRVLELPAIEVPEHLSLPADGRVEVTIQVAETGAATLEACTYDASVCALVAEALARARFAPALRGETPVAARVRVALQLAAQEPLAPTEPGAPAAPEAGAVQATPEVASPDEESAESFAATASVVKPQPGMRRLELAETRDMPGAFGDPFRAVEAHRAASSARLAPIVY